MQVRLFIGFFLMISFSAFVRESIQAQSIPIIKATTVSGQNEVRIEWELPVGGIADGFIVEHFIYRDASNNTSFQELATINGADAQSYIHQNANPGTQREIYRIKSIFNGAESLPSEEMQTIHLFPEISFNPCELTNTIQWTEFFQTFAPVTYEISYNSDGGRIFYPLASLQGPELELVGQEKTYGSFNNSDNLTNIYAFTHENIDPDQTYFYRVEARYGDGNSSFSNICSRNSPAYQRPAPPQLQYVSVNEDGSVELKGVADLSATLSGLDIYRSETDVQSLQLIQELQAPSTPTINITDDQANTSAQAYYYQLNLLDSCGKILEPNEIHRTIYLEASIANETEAQLSWNDYEGWTPEGYRVFRKIGGNDFEEIDQTQDPEYIDNSLAFQTMIGKVFYYVEAFSNVYGDDAVSSSSNRISLNFESELFVANAFRPGGITPTFKPVSRFEPFAAYRFQIYNRWGQLVFESSEPQQGWDGTFNGEAVDTGNFVWLLNYTKSDGTAISKQGNVMLMR